MILKWGLLRNWSMMIIHWFIKITPTKNSTLQCGNKDFQMPLAWTHSKFLLLNHIFSTTVPMFTRCLGCMLLLSSLSFFSFFFVLCVRSMACNLLWINLKHFVTFSLLVTKHCTIKGDESCSKWHMITWSLLRCMLAVMILPEIKTFLFSWNVELYSGWWHNLSFSFSIHTSSSLT